MKIVKIKFIKKINHNILRIVTEKPPYFQFTPGEATYLSINLPGWKNEKRPFTFTSLPNQNDLEFIIKTYPEHKCFTNRLLSLQPEDEFLLDNPFGSITYKGEGVFIAGGAGITPFVSIFKDVVSQGKKLNSLLLFANKTSEDIILETELNNWLENKVIHILSEQKAEKYHEGFITAELIKKNCTDLGQFFYVCGPPKMMSSVLEVLKELGISQNKIVKETL